MNLEQERADFEAWYQHHHGDRDVYALDESGEYVDKQVQGAFNVWLARAALQSQDQEDAQRFRKIMNMTRAEREEVLFFASNRDVLNAIDHTPAAPGVGRD